MDFLKISAYSGLLFVFFYFLNLLSLGAVFLPHFNVFSGYTDKIYALARVFSLFFCVFLLWGYRIIGEGIRDRLLRYSSLFLSVLCGVLFILGLLFLPSTMKGDAIGGKIAPVLLFLGGLRFLLSMVFGYSIYRKRDVFGKWGKSAGILEVSSVVYAPLFLGIFLFYNEFATIGFLILFFFKFGAGVSEAKVMCDYSMGKSFLSIR